MKYSIEVVRKENQVTTNWSGGTTTQLAIYPKEAVYNERNFKWRISSARVEIEESEFTPLPGISRYIMVIEGELALEHVGHHEAHLKAFDVDNFSGDWVTRSVGKVKDFNLMIAQGCQGEIKAIQLEREKSFEIVKEKNSWDDKYTYLTEGFYCAQGKVEVAINKSEKICLIEGDLLLFTIEKQHLDLKLKVNRVEEQSAKVIRASILYDAKY